MMCFSQDALNIITRIDPYTTHSSPSPPGEGFRVRCEVCNFFQKLCNTYPDRSNDLCSNQIHRLGLS